MSAELGRSPLRGLYAVTPEEADTAKLVERVAACIEGGARAVQYRAKALAPAVRHAQARALVALCRSRRVPLIVNDSIELALAVGADGVHLGREDPDPRAARAQGRALIIGVSCYNEPQRARAAADAGADYVAIGSMFPSATKPGAVHAALASLGEAKEISRLPVVAIGGITANNARDVIDAGADMVAVIDALFRAPDVHAAAHAIARLFNQPRDGTDDVRAQPRTV